MFQILQSLRLGGFWYSDTWKQRLRGMVILGVLGLSAVLGFLHSEDIYIVALGLTGFLLVTAILIRWPALGIFGALFGAFFLHFTGPGGVNFTVLALLGTVVLWIIDMIVRQRKISLAESNVNLALIVFIACSFISFLSGQLPWYPLARQAELTAQLGGLLIFVLSALSFLMVGNLMRGLRWLQWFTWLFLAIGAFFIILRLTPPLFRIFARFYYPNTTANAIFWIWLLVITFSQLFLNRHLNKVWRAGLAVLLAAILYVSVVQSYAWKSGFIPPLAGVAFIIALLLRRRVIWFLPVILAAAVVMGMLAIQSDQYSWFSRLEAWIIVSKLTLVNPIFGIGFANYYWYTLIVPINGWFVSFNSHSQYVDIFSQTGVVGLLCFFWIFWEIGKLGWRLKDRVPEGFAKAYVYGVMGGVAGTLVAGGLVDWALPFVYNIGMYGYRASVLGWLFLGGIVTINHFVKQSESGMPANAVDEISATS